MTAIIKAKIQKVMVSVATLEQQEVTVNSIKLFEGEGQGARQVKVDATINASITYQMRRASGQDAILVTTCGYDEKGKARDKARERWIPAGQDTNGSTPTRADVWQTILAVTTDHNGLHLNTDGKTFKLRVPNERQRSKGGSGCMRARLQPADSTSWRGPQATSRCTLSSDDCVMIFFGKLRIHDHNGEAKAMRRD